MIQFSHRNEKTTKLFATVFWILAGFHIIFGCISELIFVAIAWLNDNENADIRYVMALAQWTVS